jgi:hypothetical protein
MNERQHLELVQRNDIYIKVGSGYRLITDKRDGAGNLIDLDYNLYTTDHRGGHVPFLPGPKGDIVLPAGAEGLPPVEESASRQWGRAADKALGCWCCSLGMAPKNPDYFGPILGLSGSY